MAIIKLITPLLLIFVNFTKLFLHIILITFHENNHASGIVQEISKDADYSKMNCCTNDLLIIVGLPNLRRIRTAEEQSVKWSKVIINKMELQSVARQLDSLCFIDLCTSKHCKMVHKAEWIKTYFPKKFENPLVLLLKNLIQWLDKTAWVLTSHKLPPPRSKNMHSLRTLDDKMQYP